MPVAAGLAMASPHGSPAYDGPPMNGAVASGVCPSSAGRLNVDEMDQSGCNLSVRVVT